MYTSAVLHECNKSVLWIFWLLMLVLMAVIETEVTPRTLVLLQPLQCLKEPEIADPTTAWWRYMMQFNFIMLYADADVGPPRLAASGD